MIVARKANVIAVAKSISPFKDVVDVAAVVAATTVTVVAMAQAVGLLDGEAAVAIQPLPLVHQVPTPTDSQSIFGSTLIFLQLSNS